MSWHECFADGVRSSSAVARDTMDAVKKNGEENHVEVTENANDANG